MKKILFIQNSFSPYRMYLFNELTEFFNVEVLYLENFDKWRKWNELSKNIKYKYNILQHKEINLFNRKITFAKFDNFDFKKYDEIVLLTNFPNIIDVTRLAIKFRKKYLILISVWEDYQVFDTSSILARFINKSLNLWIKWLISGGKKAIGYTRKSCEIVKNRECFYSTQYYHLEEEFGKITLRDVKKFNENRFKDNLNFVTISYFSPRKNIEFAIKVLNNFPNIKLHIIGSGEKSYEDFLKSISKPNIIFHGYKVGEEKAKVLKEADFFIFTTKKDSWGFVINEAFYFGLPVISSNKAMAVFELLENKQNGFIYKNEDELKIIIDEVLNRKFDFATLSLNAKNKIENFNSRVIDNFIKFLS